MTHLPGHLRTCNAGASDRLQRFSCCEPSTGLLLCAPRFEKPGTTQGRPNMRTIIIVLASLATAASLALAQTTTTPTPTPTGPTTPSTASPFLIEQFLVGSWMVTRTPTSPTPNTTTPGTTTTPNGTTGATTTPTSTPTPELVTFTATGEALESRPPLITTASGTVFETPGHGAWDFNDAGVFVVTLVALVQPAPTSTATTPAAQTLGTETVSLQLNANPSDGTLTGTFTSQTRDVTGTVTSSEQGTVQGAR